MDVMTLKKRAAKQIAARSVNYEQYRQALADFGASVDALRVVVRADDAVDYAGGNYLPIIDNEAQASKSTGDETGLSKYLLGRPDQHEDYKGLPGPVNGACEVDLLIRIGQGDASELWINARTREISQYPGAQPIPLKPEDAPAL